MGWRATGGGGALRMPELSPSLKADCGVYVDWSGKREMHDCGTYARISRIGSKKNPYGGDEEDREREAEGARGGRCSPAPAICHEEVDLCAGRGGGAGPGGLWRC